MLRLLRVSATRTLRIPPPFCPFSTSPVPPTSSSKDPPVESRWQRLKRERRNAPPPANRTVYKFDRTKLYDIPTALSHIRESKWAKFDESIDLSFRLNIDPRQADQNLRGVIDLPHGTGRMDRVAVFAEDELAGAARAVGADLVGGEDLISRIQEDKGRCLRGFRACIAVPELLPIAAAKVGKILGPKGLMPSVKTKTVTVDVADCVVRIKRGWLSYHTDRSGHVHLNVGRMTFTDEVLRENILAATRAIINARPASIKKKYIKKAIVCSSMGPSVELDIVELAKQAMGVS